MTTPLALRDAWPLYLGMSIAGAAAIVASASTLAALARTVGWSSWTPWLLPAALDIGGSVGGWCWLRPGAPARARDFGRTVAVVGAAGTLVGNGTGHLIASGYLRANATLVVVVGTVPAAVLVALAHLAALLAHPAPAGPKHLAVTAEHEPIPDSDTEPAQAPTPMSMPAASGDDAADETPHADAAGALGDTRTVVLVELSRGPATVAELVRRTGRSRTTIANHLKDLTNDGAVARDEFKRYRPITRPHAVQR